ncbi:MAG: murein peptide amidase [Actinomycetota bacterium]|nr:murein peptide amidase [Actinomycetota bacterium]
MRAALRISTTICVVTLLLSGASLGTSVGAKARGSQHLVRRRLVFGHSVRGHKLHAWEVGDPRAAPVLIVGCIHGNECAALPVARRLVHGRLPRDVDLWVVPTLNPDGLRAGTRQNAHRVDLNRNFHHLWQRIGSPGDTYYSGPYPLSEPESRAAVRFIKDVRPRVSIWFHQAENVVFGPHRGRKRIAHCYSSLVRQPYRREVLTPGSVTTWQNHRFDTDSAILDELPHWGALTGAEVHRYTSAIRTLLRWYARGHPRPCPAST